MPGPNVPDPVWEGMCYGHRTGVTAARCSDEVLARYCDHDLLPRGMVFTLGKCLLSSFSMKEKKRWIHIIALFLVRIQPRLCRPRAYLVAYLAFAIMDLSMIPRYVQTISISKIPDTDSRGSWSRWHREQGRACASPCPALLQRQSSIRVE